MQGKINKAAEMIARAKKIIVFTGAGISTESGISDFRGPGGVWSRYNPDDFTIDKFMNSGESRKKLWQWMREAGLTADVLPNAAHQAIVELEKMNKVSAVVTQNVDNLHQLAGSNPGKIYELHGNMQVVACLDCGERYPLAGIVEKNPLPQQVPVCEKCSGILKPDVVFFGEELPQNTLIKAAEEAQKCDLLIVVGSSLVVYPAAYIPLYAKNSGAGIIIINLEPTEQDDIADVLINEPAGKAMTGIMDRLKEILPQNNS